MSRKHDSQPSDPSRDKSPEGEQAGSPSAQGTDDAPASPDAQAPGAGKVANDHNKRGGQAATQVNEGRRTPESRSDRQSLAGGPQNQVSARKGGGGGGRGPRGAG